MSVISNTHNITAYDPKASKAFSGQRLAKVTYKTDKETGVKPASVCCSIPVASPSNEELQQFRPYILDWYMRQQDAIVRARHEEGAKTITDSDISCEAVAAWLAAESSGNKLTKEFLLEWFATELADNLMLAIADKLHLSDTPAEGQTKQCNQMIAGYRDSFAALAGGKTAFTPQKAEKMLKALSLASAEDNTTIKLRDKLEHMTQVAELEDLGL